MSFHDAQCKLLIPFERRDVRVVEGARLESDFGQTAYGVKVFLDVNP
jgi:hypothetical protein